MYVKVCGLDTVDNTEVAVSAGADAIGVVMSQASPRNRTLAEARTIVESAQVHAAAIGTSVDTVLVTNDLAVGEAVDTAVAIGVDVLQLHGSYDSADFEYAAQAFPRVWRATSLAGLTGFEARSARTSTGEGVGYVVGTSGEEMLLLDAPKAGSGHRWDLSALAEQRIEGRWLLAGGLNPDNVADAIAQAQPWGVDVSSGVESTRGVKDPDAIRAFVAAARQAG